MKIKINEFTDANLLKAAIDKLEFKDQRTNIYGGLEEAMNVFKPANGARSNVTKVAILLTDGEKGNDRDPDPQPIAADLKNSGVEVFVISHSHYFSKNESTITLVETIASEHLVEHLFISDDFGNLTISYTAMSQLKQFQLCSVAVEYSSADSYSHVTIQVSLVRFSSEVLNVYSRHQ